MPQISLSLSQSPSPSSSTNSNPDPNPTPVMPPSLPEITALTRAELLNTSTNLNPNSDPIHACGRPALSILASDPGTCMRLAYQKLHDVPYRDVKVCWRRLYVDAALWKVLRVLEKRGERGERGDERDKGGKGEGEEGDWVAEIVRVLDMALILTGAPGREEVVELLFSALGGIVKMSENGNGNGNGDGDMDVDVDEREQGPARKRRRLATGVEGGNASLLSETFPSTIASPPVLRCPIPRVSNPSLGAFQARLANPRTQVPIIIEDAIDHWPALHERPWNKPSYLLSHTLDGRRLVPVEIGRSYTDQSWGQKIITFKTFLSEYMLDKDKDKDNPDLSKHPSNTKAKAGSKTGYLAQHDLFTQIPSLRADISIPDYCYVDLPTLQTTVPPSPSNLTPATPEKLDTPLLNAWFGPKGTISPLHTDPYHNILSQVVGSKYIRLYPPDQTPSLHPRGTGDDGVDMSNTSLVDLDEALELYLAISPWGDCPSQNEGDRSGDGDGDGDRDLIHARRTFEDKFPGFKDAKYVEGVLGPGECLYIPPGWWHYVRSLSPSFSVSFWFN